MGLITEQPGSKEQARIRDAVPPSSSSAQRSLMLLYAPERPLLSLETTSPSSGQFQ